MTRVVTVKPVTGQPIRNDGATVVFGGNIDSSNTVTNAPGRGLVGYSGGPFASQVIDTGDGNSNIGAKKVLASGNFAKLTAGQYVIRRVSNLLAGVANTTLLSGASDFGRRSIHFKESRKIVKVVQAGWNYATGAFLSTPDNVDADFGQDHAARPTRAVPGELVYHDHGPASDGVLATPKQDDYKPITG